MEKSDNSSNVETGTRKWCSYHHSNGHSNANCYQQQSEPANGDNKKILYSNHKSGRHSDDQCYRQRSGNRNFPADSKSTKGETFIADGNVTSCGTCSCHIEVESKRTGIDDEPNNTPPGIGFSFAVCYPPLFQETGGFQLLVDSGSSKHFIDSESICGVESRMLEYTRIYPPMEITVAENNALSGTA